MARTILVVDDEDSIRNSLSGILSDEGYRVLTAFDSASAMDVISKENPGVILLDVWMTGASGEKQQEGLDLLSKIKGAGSSSMVIVMSGHGNIETAVKATKNGAYDFLEKPLSLDKVLLTVQNAFHLKELSTENENLRARVAKSRLMIGETPVMRHLSQQIRRVAPSHSWVLITGENGTGKELVSHTIFALSGRYNKPFVEVNCAAIPEELIESELFGHEKGSFTGATQQKRGRFETANGGTLFLDEIGDMSLKTQAKILRILQEQRFERVGGNQTIVVDVRVIAATNKNLEEEIKRGFFREDLYHRLNVIPLKVPPLRERKEDIPLFLENFLKEFSLEVTKKTFNSKAVSLLKSYSWPGNVRELKNTVERLVILTEGDEIKEDDVLTVMPQMSAPSAVLSYETTKDAMGLDTSLKDAKTGFEKDFILKKLNENDWNVSRTANLLGIERSHLHKKIKTYGLEDKIKE